MSANLFTNFGANATLNVATGKVAIKGVTCYNGNAAARYLQLHNTATTPSASAVPAWFVLVPAGQMIVLGNDFFGDDGMLLGPPGTTFLGCAFAFSTTARTYTAGTATDQDTQIMWNIG